MGKAKQKPCLFFFFSERRGQEVFVGVLSKAAFSLLYLLLISVDASTMKAELAINQDSQLIVLKSSRKHLKTL